ncbi:uncharacterized protein FFUJ_11265 [Fusarium fujikuroi IMI 58289]|uniref:Uncharacterized protein n=1 Tax=Gibberella fujikuroi (strain CBS 195.34 / IMI 58289 / NRRL A-6831) TaxID=1279085 RepID=S0EPJ3_GIBF5|nr:uncharacterized protein FFUJ_11265 [Fusarium fujikuroi IMI 58289]CCT75240.1 uncharacterized protein FFUJ_11265 [Fusarium fujikuroi IMI 58289]SCO25603.1 uncharacterized protein FFM5_14181 [Fusarium fujikuroi]
MSSAVGRYGRAEQTWQRNHYDHHLDHNGPDNPDLDWELNIVPSIAAYLDEELETSKLRDTLCDKSSGIAECDVPLGNLEGYDSPQMLPTSQSTSSPIQVTIFSPSEYETQSPPSFSRSLSGTSQSPSTLASASNPATPQLSLSRYKFRTVKVSLVPRSPIAAESIAAGSAAESTSSATCGARRTRWKDTDVDAGNSFFDQIASARMLSRQSAAAALACTRAYVDMLSRASKSYPATSAHVINRAPLVDPRGDMNIGENIQLLVEKKATFEK